MSSKMLQRSKSNRSSNNSSTNRRTHVESLDDRCSDGDSSQSSAAAAPVFASVHRPRGHAGLNAIKREGMPAATTKIVCAEVHRQQHQSTATATTAPRQSYQKYQQQRRLQQQQQKQQQLFQMQQQQQQQQFAFENSNHQQHQQQHAMQKMPKTKNNWHEQQKNSSLSATTGAGVETAAMSAPMKQSIVVAIPEAPGRAKQIFQINSKLQQQRTHHNQQEQQQQHVARMQMQPQQHYQQHQQQQQLHSQPNFNQISKTATNLLNDIYEKHLLNQTTFQDQRQQQQQQQSTIYHQHLHQQQQNVVRYVAGPNEFSFTTTHRSTKQQKPPTQYALKLPATPAVPPPQRQQCHQLDVLTNAMPHHFQFSDAYVEPVDSTNNKRHFLADSQPPPPPAPLNHVYETIKERPPMPPPPPERPARSNPNGKDVAPLPPLPPSRQLKKRLLATSNTNGRNKKSANSTTKRNEETEPQKNAKMLPTQPPAYVAPPSSSKQLHQQQQQLPQLHQSTKYNTQERTKADGEQKAHNHYQQLREQQQFYPHPHTSQQFYPHPHQPQQQQQPHQNHGIQQKKIKAQIAKMDSTQFESKQKPSNNSIREHPLGASSNPSNIGAITTNTDVAIVDTTSNAVVNNKQQTVAGDLSFNCTTTTSSIHSPTAGHTLSVEQTLQQAGLLKPSSSALASSSTAFASLNYSNNNNSIGNNSIIINGGNNHNNRPNALPIVFEEDTGEFQDVLVLEEDGTAKLQYRHGEIEVRLETAQAMAAAAYYARAAQRLAHSVGQTRIRSTEMSNPNARNGGFCGALQRAPPPMPPGLARRLANKENYGLGKVKVMLRVSDTNIDAANPHFMNVDKKKRQVTLTDPAAASIVAASTSQERGPMVAAPKMFAFDNLFTTEDQQSDICASALSEVIPAVLEGSDGCLLTIGYPNSGQAKTMLGSGVNPPSDLGAIPSAISWLYKGINERRQKSGARFSVRVSALGVSATKPDSSSKDLLAAHATESDDSPGVYLRDDFLGGPTELRAPTAERAALFLDAALAGRPQGGLEPAMIFTLHVYQYSLSRKGGVAGGRSRLHLIDLGGCANRAGGLPLSGIGNILLAILSGQRHPPNKDHPLTPLLKDCLAPLTCHVAIVAHVMHTQSHTDALTTIQLASRIHRMRRRKHRFPLGGDKSGNGLAAALNGGHQSTGSSAGSGADPSSSELSADTVIYMGPSDDATDGEHPPVYLPSLSCGDNRCVMVKALKGSGVEKQTTTTSATKTPTGTPKKINTAQKPPQSPTVVNSRTGSLKRSHTNTLQVPIMQQPQANGTNDSPYGSPVHGLKNLNHSNTSPKIVSNTLRHPNMTTMCSKGSNVPSPKGSPLRRPGVGGTVASDQPECPGSPMRKIVEEQWIDGPRVSRAKVAEARHLLREVNHVKQCETWIDGPKSQSSRSLTAGNLPTAASQVQGYGFMDSHKKSMIRQWVENQTSQVFQTSSAASSPTHSSAAHREQQAQHLRNITYHMSQLKQKSLDAAEELYATSLRQQQHTQQQATNVQYEQNSLRGSQLELVHPIGVGLTTAISTTNASAPAEIRGAANYRQAQQPQQPHIQNRDETEIHSMHSHPGYGTISESQQQLAAATASASDTAANGHHGDVDEDQDSGPSEVPPALPLIEPLGSREISHESLHRILSRHVSRESLYQQQQQELRVGVEALARQATHHFSQHSIVMSDCGLQVTEEEIARTMGSEHPLAALSHCENMSIVSSFNMAGDAFSDCAMGDRTRNQFDQLARLREIFTSQLAMAEVTPVFRSGCDVGSVYSEPAFRFNTGPGSVCSEPPYRPPSPRQPSRSPSQGSLPSLNGIMQIAGMEQYASLRHPDGASDPNLPKHEKPFIKEHDDITEVDEKTALLSLPPSKRPSLEDDTEAVTNHLNSKTLPITSQSQLPLLPLNTSSEAYDSGHDSSTPRTSKHSGISRRAESGYHSVATVRDSDESSFTSGLSKENHNRITIPASQAKKKRQDKGLCNWLINPFTCTYPETEGEISDF